MVKKASLDARLRMASSVLVSGGMFTASWDRFANIMIGSFNVKLPVILFAMSVLFMLILVARRAKIPGTPQPLVVVVWITFVIFIFSGLIARFPLTSMLQAVTVLFGAIVPFFAVYGSVRMSGDIDRTLTYFVRGGYVAAIFGLYQLAAFYLKIPQGIQYKAVAGGLGRISSFCYESGYFTYFLVLVIAALLARQRLRNRPIGFLAPAFFITVLLLANSRTDLILIPLVVLLLAMSQPKTNIRKWLGAWGIFAAALGTFAALMALFQPRLFSSVITRAASIFDPHEVSSNSPRLDAIGLVWKLAQNHLWVGMGPGNLAAYVRESNPGLLGTVAPNNFVVNDAWLQALVDGGVLLVVSQAVLAVLSFLLFRKKNPLVARTLLVGWIPVFIVSSVGNSYFWDLKLWIVLGLVLAIVSLHQAGKLSDSSDSELSEGGLGDKR